MFYDNWAITIEDPDSFGEQRFITIDMDFKLQVLVAVNVQREGDTIRLISARKANSGERKQYEG